LPVLAVKKAQEFDGKAMSGLGWSNLLQGGVAVSAGAKAPAKKVAMKKAVPEVVKKAAAKKVSVKKASPKK